MKEIKAFIKPHKLTAVALALHQIRGVTGMSVLDARGFGRDRPPQHRAIDDVVDFEPHTRIEVACRDEQVEEVVEAIRQAAYTGLPGDGKIYVSALEAAVRIQTGERSDAAV